MTWQSFKEAIDNYLRQNTLPETIEVDYIDVSPGQIPPLEIHHTGDTLAVYGWQNQEEKS